MSMDRRGFLGLVSLGALAIAARTKPADPEPEEHDTDYRRDGVYVFEGGEWHRVARFYFVPEPPPSLPCTGSPPMYGTSGDIVLSCGLSADPPRELFRIEAARGGAAFVVGEE